MAVSLYFGLPGCGKTTTMSMIAFNAIKRKRYVHVYSNVNFNIPGVIFISNDVIGYYDLSDSLILIDEATLFADNRDYKQFSKERIQFFLEHRHYHCDIVLFTQQWDAVDRKIRVITDRVYYCYKGIFTGHWITKIVRIPYGILFPDPKRSGEKLGEIVQGYSKPPLIKRIFARLVFRPRYYSYFDSWEAPALPVLPVKYQPYPGTLKKERPFWAFLTSKKLKRSKKEDHRISDVINEYLFG